MSLASQEILDKAMADVQLLRLKGSIVSVEDCKLYRGPVPPSPHIDRELVKRFFIDLGLYKGKSNRLPFPANNEDVEEELQAIRDNSAFDQFTGFEGSDSEDELGYSTPPEFALAEEEESGFEYTQFERGDLRPKTPAYIDAEAGEEEVGFETNQYFEPPKDAVVDDIQALANKEISYSSESEEEAEILGRTRAQTKLLREAKQSINEQTASLGNTNIDTQCLASNDASEELRVDRHVAAKDFLNAFSDRERSTAQDDAIEQAKNVFASE